MKQETTNVFNEGLILDLNPLTTPNNVLSNALNATLITVNGNEFVLQNDMGNGRVETAKLPTGFVPLGVKEYGGIIYVASYNPITQEGQLGSFPSPETNLTQDEIDNRQIVITHEQFKENDEIVRYYKRYDIMPNDMYLNPGDKFGLFITGSSKSLLSYFTEQNSRLVTLHPAVVDSFGNINYIDDDCKVDGLYQRGLIYGETPNLGSVDGIRAAFDKCLVYKGKRSGKLVLIAELETLEDFSVSRSILSSKGSDTEVNKTGSSQIGFADDPSETEIPVTYIVQFYCYGWPKIDNTYIQYTGVRIDELDEGGGVIDTKQVALGDNKNQSLMFALGGWTKGEGDNTILRYKITPYTQLGPVSVLAKTGVINFNLLGTGNIILNEWRYYVENNEIRINYGFDINLLEGEYVSSVTMQFYDVFFNLLYETPYICSSTVEGNWNGSYTETFRLPYDLKYTDTYQEGVDNHDWLYVDVLNGKKDRTFRLRSNELLKNNFYLVKITLNTGGLRTENGQEDQTSKREFYRFMYTTGIFNQQYVEGVETNFSILRADQISPYNVTLKATVDESTLDIQYLGEPTENGDMTKMCSSTNTTRREEIDQEYLKSNLYQDFVVKSGTVKLSGEIKNIDSSQPLEGGYYTFGEYNPGWISISQNTELTNDDITVLFDDSAIQVQQVNGTPSDEVIDYVDISDEEAVDLSTIENVNSILTGTNNRTLLDVFGSDIILKDLNNLMVSESDTTAIEERINLYKSLLDKEFYYIDDRQVNISDEGSETEDPSLTISNIYGRLIRRIASEGYGSESNIKCNEVRPCFYPGMSDEELQWMFGMGTVSSTGETINPTGRALKAAGFWCKTSTPSAACIGTADTYADFADEPRAWDFNPHDNDAGTDYTTIQQGLADVLGGTIPGYPACIPIQTTDPANDDRFDGGNGAYLGIGNLNDAAGILYADYCMKVEDSGKYALLGICDEKNSNNACTILLWRGKNSTPSLPVYYGVNVAALNYGRSAGNHPTLTELMTKIFSKIYILQPEIMRKVYIKAPSKIAYSNTYNTKVSIGISLGTEKESKITVNKSPVRLYKAADEEYVGSAVDVGEFSKTNVRNKITETAKDDEGNSWNPDDDKWYESVEDYGTGTPDWLQCSWLNIPYPKIKDDNEDELKFNNDPRDEENPIDINFDNLLKKEGENEGDPAEYFLTVDLELGGSIMVEEDLLPQWQAVASDLSNYSTPVYQYVPVAVGSTYSFDTGHTTDILGANFTTDQVYYLKDNGWLIGGNTPDANEYRFSENRPSISNYNYKYQGRIIPVMRSDDKYRIPTFDTDMNSRTENFRYVRSKNSGDDRTVRFKDFKMYIDFMFDWDTTAFICTPNSTKWGPVPN